MERTASHRLCATLLAIALAGGLGCSGSDDGPACTATDPPEVRDEYLAEDLTLESTNCSEAITEILQQVAAAAEDCNFELSQNGASVSAVDCDDLLYTGCVDNTGEIEVSALTQDAVDNCAVAIGITLIASGIAGGATTAEFDMSIGFGGCGGQQNCEATFVSDWIPLLGSASQAGAASQQGSAATRLMSSLLDSAD